MIGTSRCPLTSGNQWENYLAQLNTVGLLRIPRWIGSREETMGSEQLVAFSDASLVAQAAAIYGVNRTEQGQRRSRLLCARTKVSPLRKQETVARLELQAALMAVELTREVGIAFKMDFKSALVFYRLYHCPLVVEVDEGSAGVCRKSGHKNSGWIRCLPVAAREDARKPGGSSHKRFDSGSLGR